MALRAHADEDTATRHRIVAALVGPARTVLDAGGVPGRLALPGATVTTANVAPPADVVYDGDALPFADGTFDAVTSLDVLEHIAPEGRRRHVDELRRVARDRIVVCTPLGTPAHVAAERSLADWLADLSGARDAYLDEHLLRGLPTEAELRALAPDATLRFHGDFRDAQALFALRALAHFRRRPGDRLRYARRRLRPPADRGLEAAASPWTNRAYLVIAAG